jgi:hypothetical protein
LRETFVQQLSVDLHIDLEGHSTSFPNSSQQLVCSDVGCHARVAQRRVRGEFFNALGSELPSNTGSG